jgi:hypothetical protein
MKSILCILTSLLFIASVRVANGATVPTGFTDSLVAGGLTNPTAMALAPDGRMFVCEKGASCASSKMALCWPRLL